MNKIQRLQLELIRHARWNLLDGKRVARDLERHQRLWEAAFATHANPGGILSGLKGGEHYADILFILPKPGRETELVSMAHGWRPDEMIWEALGFHQHFEPAFSMGEREPTMVLRLWWD